MNTSSILLVFFYTKSIFPVYEINCFINIFLKKFRLSSYMCMYISKQPIWLYLLVEMCIKVLYDVFAVDENRKR